MRRFFVPKDIVADVTRYCVERSCDVERFISILNDGDVFLVTSAIDELPHYAKILMEMTKDGVTNWITDGGEAVEPVQIRVLSSMDLGYWIDTIFGDNCDKMHKRILVGRQDRNGETETKEVDLLDDEIVL